MRVDKDQGKISLSLEFPVAGHPDRTKVGTGDDDDDDDGNDDDGDGYGRLRVK